MLIFIDTETTGLDKSDKIISIALIVIENGNLITKMDLINEGKKIPPKASSINHITNEMIKGKPELQDSETFRYLMLNNIYDVTLISHNIQFILNMLNRACGFVWQGKIIDTLRVSKHLMPECEEYSLQFLRYDLKLYKDEKEKTVPHEALSDARLIKQLYECLLELASKEEMYELSVKNVLMSKFEFGKYGGRYIEEISMLDRGYLEWMLNNILDLDEDLRYSIKYYLEG